MSTQEQLDWARESERNVATRRVQAAYVISTSLWYFAAGAYNAAYPYLVWKRAPQSGLILFGIAFFVEAVLEVLSSAIADSGRRAGRLYMSVVGLAVVVVSHLTLAVLAWQSIAVFTRSLWATCLLLDIVYRLGSALITGAFDSWAVESVNAVGGGEHDHRSMFATATIAQRVGMLVGVTITGFAIIRLSETRGVALGLCVSGVALGIATVRLARLRERADEAVRLSSPDLRNSAVVLASHSGRPSSLSPGSRLRETFAALFGSRAAVATLAIVTAAQMNSMIFTYVWPLLTGTEGHAPRLFLPLLLAGGVMGGILAKRLLNYTKGNGDDLALATVGLIVTGIALAVAAGLMAFEISIWAVLAVVVISRIAQYFAEPFITSLSHGIVETSQDGIRATLISGRNAVSYATVALVFLVGGVVSSRPTPQTMAAPVLLAACFVLAAWRIGAPALSMSSPPLAQAGREEEHDASSARVGKVGDL